MRVAFKGRELGIQALSLPLVLDSMAVGAGGWEVEIGFGKGRYLLHRAGQEAELRFLGIEVASQYYRRVRERVVKRRLDNVVLVRGEAVYVLTALLPKAFADRVHVYFPDPWPKARHRNRRLFDAERVDLILGLLKPNGVLSFATDFVEYGDWVHGMLRSHPGVRTHKLAGGWPDGARTNYERKYERLGRSIVRLETRRTAPAGDSLLHPLGMRGIATAVEGAGGEAPQR